MRGGIPLGRMFGIAIRVDWSWLFIFLLVTWNLTIGFAQLHPDWSMVLTLGIAVIAALLFFASVLAHELAHSLVAKAQGLSVRNITLFLFGGVSNIQQEPPSAWAEFLIAIVGPLTSIIIGIICLLLAGVASLGNAVAAPMQMLAQISPLTTLLLWLGPINILLGVFNMVPGFPLDGGRVLRAVLWGATNSFRTATRWASWIGQAIAWLMIALGIAVIFGLRFPILGTSFISGLWLAFIGWFLNTAAVQSYQQIVIRDMLEGVPVSRLARTHVPTVAPNETVETLVHDLVMGTDERAFPVIQQDSLVGLVCLDDIRKVPRTAWNTTTVQQIMTPADQLIQVAPEEDAGEAFEKLVRRDVNQAPVMQADHFVGMLRLRDIVRWLDLQSHRVPG